MDDGEPSEMTDPRVTTVSTDKPEDKQLKLIYAVFDIDEETPPADRQGETRQVTILHTSYGRGLVEPAEDRACPTWSGPSYPPVGGLPRRATLLKEALSEDPGALLVDTGWALGGNDGAYDTWSDEYLVEGLAAMGYDALNAGVGELGAAAPVLQRLAGLGGPTLISSNAGLPTSSDGLICDLAGLRVGLIGVTSPGATSGGPDATHVDPAVEALRAILPEVRRQADVIVVLADLEPAEIRELAEAELDVQVVLGGRYLQCQELTWFGQTAAVAVGGDGRYVGKLTLEVDSQGQVVGAENRIRVLGQSVPDDPEIAALRDRHRDASA